MSTKFDFKKKWHTLTPDQKKQFAEDFGSSMPHLANVANGHKVPSSRFMRMLEIDFTEFEKNNKTAA